MQQRLLSAVSLILIWGLSSLALGVQSFKLDVTTSYDEGSLKEFRLKLDSGSEDIHELDQAHRIVLRDLYFSFKQARIIGNSKKQWLSLAIKPEAEWYSAERIEAVAKRLQACAALIDNQEQFMAFGEIWQARNGVSDPQAARLAAEQIKEHLAHDGCESGYEVSRREFRSWGFFALVNHIALVLIGEPFDEGLYAQSLSSPVTRQTYIAIYLGFLEEVIFGDNGLLSWELQKQVVDTLSRSPGYEEGMDNFLNREVETNLFAELIRIFERRWLWNSGQRRLLSHRCLIDDVERLWLAMGFEDCQWQSGDLIEVEVLQRRFLTVGGWK